MKNKEIPIAEFTTSSGLKIVVGNHYIIDKEFRNGSEIEVVKIYGKFFCRVKSVKGGGEWDAMLYRLSAIEKA